jgi:hypothetical protein
MLAQGLSNSAIADRLGLSLKTVNNNTSSIFSKLNVGTRTEAAILARDRGSARPDLCSWRSGQWIADVGEALAIGRPTVDVQSALPPKRSMT